MTRHWLMILLAVTVTACSNSPSKPTEQTEQELYKEARDTLENGSQLAAIEKLKDLESRYPFGRYAEQAQLELIYAYYNSANMESALEAAERFIRLHPLHPQVDYAYYIRALATYDMGFSMIERRFSDDVAKRDPTPLQDAFRYFSELLTRFPDSPYVADSRARMVYLRERLASHEVGVARYYMKRHAFIAAANRGQKVMTEYPRTRAVADAMALMIEAYEELGMKDEEQKTLALLKLNYPDYPQLQDGEFVSSGLAKTDRRTWLEIISFGLFGSED
ncbi:outer membrane protein assembly factor BamD [Oceanobacter mangrovi]|uniref:outer membrane protein assembly factor BamD n=1 Tax=Oceanobacter mangrovi TaxID=2862510 RepID=UPI001C8E2392|nr:outer membrane protein assembly factor BamD [Oceanobacter mangrovi]